MILQLFIVLMIGISSSEPNVPYDNFAAPLPLIDRSISFDPDFELQKTVYSSHLNSKYQYYKSGRPMSQFRLYAKAPIVKQDNTRYEYSYGIQDFYSGYDFGHSEKRGGEITSGSYYVQLPDSRTQIVKYYADSRGYHAEVSYLGTAKFPPSYFR